MANNLDSSNKIKEGISFSKDINVDLMKIEKSEIIIVTFC